MSSYLLDYLIPFTLVISLFLSWKDINARFLVLTFLFVEFISLSTVEWALEMPMGFYAWSMLIYSTFLTFVFGRRFWASKLSSISLFNQIYDNHRYTPQEAILVIIFGFSVVINLVTLIEVYLYKIYFIDNAYFKLYVRDNLQHFLLFLAAFLCLSFGVKVFSSKSKLSTRTEV